MVSIPLIVILVLGLTRLQGEKQPSGIPRTTTSPFPCGTEGVAEESGYHLCLRTRVSRGGGEHRGGDFVVNIRASSFPSAFVSSGGT